MTNFKDIPIIIPNRDRLTFLKILISAMQKRGYYNIVIIDNASTYEPLFEYYKTEKSLKVIRLKENLGHTALDWLFPKYKNKIDIDYKKNWYVYTDPDVVPTDTCSDNFIEIMIEICKQYGVDKVGPCLKIDDIENQDAINWGKGFWSSDRKVQLKQSIIDMDSKLFVNKINGSIELYKAEIDTTFAVVQPNKSCGYTKNSIRIGGDFCFKHLPWYYNFAELPEDEQYYIKHRNKNIGYWSDKLEKQSKKRQKDTTFTEISSLGQDICPECGIKRPPFIPKKGLNRRLSCKSCIEYWRSR